MLLLGDGAFGFSGMEFDTLARHGVNVVGVMGNNGIWALEKHPMEFLYGYSVAADLRPETRYDAGRRGARRPRRAGGPPGRRRAGARARVRVGQAGAGERADRPDGRLPAQVEPRLRRSAPPPGCVPWRAAPTRRPRGAALRRRGCRARRPRRSSSANARIASAEQDHAGDDRGRAVGVQADDLAALLFGHLGEAREQQFDGCRAAARSRARGRGRRGRAPGRSPRRRWRCRRPRSPR